MGNTKERRLMDKLTDRLLEKFNGIESFQVKDVIDFIVKEEDNEFNLGFFFIHDRLKSTFKLGGVSQAVDCQNAEEEIRGKIKKLTYSLDPNECLSPGCGLFYYVAMNFIKDNQSDENYQAINDIDKFKKERNDLAQYNINIDTLDSKVKSQYLFPVYIVNERKADEKQSKILHAVIALVSFSDRNNLQKHDLKLLSDLISFIISVEARKIANRAIHTFINTLSDVGKVSYSRNEYEKIIQALERLYVEKEENDTLKQCLLKHASIWTLNETDNKNMFLVKERNFNYQQKKGKMDLTDIITHRTVPESSETHFFYDFIIKRKKKIDASKENRRPLPFHELVETLKFKDIKNRFYKRKEFQNQSNIEDDDIVVLFPILPHLEPDAERKKFIGLMVLYFAQNTCANYYKTGFLELIAHKIYENMQIVIQKTRREIRQAIFEKIAGMLKDEWEFCQTAAGVIKRKMDFEHCLVYLFNEDQTRLILKTKDNENKFPEEMVIRNETTYGCLKDILISRTGAITEDYFQRLKVSKTGDKPFLWYSQDAIAPDGQITADDIYSAMLIPIEVSENATRGILVCLNNKRNIDGKKESDHSFFSSKDIEIASIGAESIAIYVELSQLAVNYRQLLRKLAHEIPGQMNFIRQANRQIKEELESIIDRLRQKLDPDSVAMIIPDYKRRLLFNLIGQQSQAARRVQLFAEYSRLERLDAKNIDRERQPLYLEKFLASTIDEFRLSAEKQGIFVQFELEYALPHQPKNTIDVHPLFELAIWNLINNAIQYAFFGTVIHITCEFGLNFNRIHVEDIGIGIPPEMEEKIFAEGIRTEAARKKFFKGAGLGLPLAQKVVEAHSGEVLIKKVNDICNRNIFGLCELKRILERLPTDADRERFINQKTPDTDRKQYADFKTRLEMTAKEKEILSGYSKFLPSRSERADKNLIKDYLKELFEDNENLAILFEREIDVPVSYVRFSIQLPLNIRNF